MEAESHYSVSRLSNAASTLTMFLQFGCSFFLIVMKLSPGPWIGPDRSKRIWSEAVHDGSTICFDLKSKKSRLNGMPRSLVLHPDDPQKL